MASYSSTMTYDNFTDNDFSFNAWAAAGMEMVIGSFTTGAVSGTSSDGGLAFAIKGLATVALCVVEPHLSNVASGVMLQYNYSKAAIDIFFSSATETLHAYFTVGSDVSVTNIGGTFFAMGPRG